MENNGRWIALAAALGLCTAYVVWSDRQPSVTPPQPNPPVAVPEAVKPQTQTKVAGNSKLKFDPDFIDFGELPFYESKSQEVKIINTGEAVVNITNVVPGCSCAQAEIPVRQINPGATEKMTITYKSVGKKGKETSISIQTDERTRTNLIYTIHGKTFVPFTIEPEMLQFGFLDKNESKSITARLKRSDGKPFEISNIAAGSNRKEFKFGWTPANRDKTEYSVTATMTGLTAGVIGETAAVLTDHPTAKAIPLTLSATVNPEIKFEPGNLISPRIENNIVVPFQMTVKRRTPGPLKIESVKESTGLPVQFEAAPIDEGSCKLTIRFTEPYTRAQTFGQFMVQTNADEKPVNVQFHVNMRRPVNQIKNGRFMPDAQPGDQEKPGKPGAVEKNKP